MNPETKRTSELDELLIDAEADDDVVQSSHPVVSRPWLLLLGLSGYLAMLWHQSRHYARTYPAPDSAKTGAGRFWSGTLLQVLAGLGLLSLAGHLLLEAAVEVATDLGLSERIIGLTVVAICTSMPELAAALIAALRGEPLAALQAHTSATSRAFFRLDEVSS
jgi:Ca2+/Na+ antiporter